MTSDVERRVGDVHDRANMRARQIAKLDADDVQFRRAWPDEGVLESGRWQNLRLAQETSPDYSA